MKSVRNRRATGALLVAIACGMVFLPQISRAQTSSEVVVAVYPVVFSRNSGNEASRAAGTRTFKEVLVKHHYTVLSDADAVGAWKRLSLRLPVVDRPASLKSIVEFGRAVKARYVITSFIDFRSRNTTGVPVHNITTAYVGISIFDIADGKPVYDRQNVTGTSDEKLEAGRMGAELLATPLPVIARGSKHVVYEQRAVQIAVVKALRGWVHATDADVKKVP